MGSQALQTSRIGRRKVEWPGKPAGSANPCGSVRSPSSPRLGPRSELRRDPFENVPSAMKFTPAMLRSRLILAAVCGPLLCRAIAGAHANDQTNRPPPTAPPSAKPSPIAPLDLPAVFRKPTPTSLDDLKAIEQQVKAILARVSRAVVAVEIGGATGSGVVISEDGLVLTVAHVCDRPNRDV